MKDLLPQLAPVLGSVLSLLLGDLLLKLRKLITNRVANEEMRKILEHLSDVAGEVVPALMQTVVDKVKAANAGKLPEADAQAVKAQAMTEVKRQLGPQAMLQLAKVVGDDNVNHVISSRIESAVASNKLFRQ